MFFTIYSRNVNRKKHEKGGSGLGWRTSSLKTFYSLKRGSPAAYASADRAKVTERKS